MANKTFTDEAVDFITEENFYQVFESLNDYVDFVMEQTNFSDAVSALKDLDRKLDSRTIYLSQDTFYFFGDMDNVYVGSEIDEFFEENGFEGQIYN